MPSPSHTSLALYRDHRGAIMVAGVFMAFFVIGMLYFLIGIGDAIFYRERLQDAADAAAYSAAVMHARGMNFIVLINIVMAALLAILVALRLVETVSIVAISVLMGVSWLFPGAGAAAYGTERLVRKPAKMAHDASKPVIYPSLVALNKAATAVKYLAPAVAQLRTVDTVVGNHRPQAKWGFAMPSRLSLPVEDGQFGTLCGKAGETAGDVALLPLSPILPDVAKTAVVGTLENLTRELSGWFCGEPGAAAPQPVTTKYDAGYPQLATMEACRDFRIEAPNDDAKAKAICNQADRELERSIPDERTGACTDAACGADSPYQQRLRDARHQCDPARHHDIKEYRWQQRTLEIDEAFDPARQRWVELARREGPPTRIVGSRPPCGANGSVATTWTYDDQGEVDVPLCETPLSRARATATPKQPPSDEAGTRGDTPVRTLHLLRVTQILGCIREETTPPATLDASRPDPATTGTRCDGRRSLKAPKRLLADLELGDEAFQQRAVVFGRRAPERAGRVIEVATWGRQSDAWSEAASEMGDWMRLFAAQSEYFYGDNHPRGEWMWHMSWKARLRRFRLPSSRAETAEGPREECLGGLLPEIPASLQEACELAASDAHDAGCGRIDRKLRSLQRLVVH